MTKSLKTLLISSMIFFIIILLNNNTFAQTVVKYVIKGTLIDSSSRKPIPYSSIALTTQAGKNIIKSGMTDDKGFFSFPDIRAGKYDLEISSMSYGKKTKSITLAGANTVISLGSIKISKQTVQLPDVVIEDFAAPIIVKEDTIEFNAASFKTDSNAMVEDLIKKLPGVEVDNNGTITAHGTQVTKVLVDGKPFFGNDPVMATRNIPIDMIDKVQVIDAKSDQAVFTGVDDGSVEKVMNLITKPGRRNGTFGKMTAGGGGEYNDNNDPNKLDRFDAGGNVNWYNGSTQLSLIGTANNINNIRFGDFSALGQSSSGGPGGPGGRGPGGFGGSSNNSGISTSYSLGANFRDSIGHKISFTGSYLFTENETDKIQTSARQTFLSDTLGNSFYNSNSVTKTTNINHNLNLEFDYRIDSMNSILFRPKIKITESNSNQNSNYATFFGNDTINSNFLKRNDTINSGTSNLNYVNNYVYNYSSQILLRHRFNKPRRTISLDVTPSYNSTNSESFNISTTNMLLNNIMRDSIINQQKDNKTGDFNLSSRLSYTEPLSESVVMEFDWSLNYDNSYSDRKAYNYDTVSKSYTNNIDYTYTNHYQNTYLDNRVGVNIKFFREKWDYTFGLGVEPSELTSHAMYALNKDTTLTQKVVNFSPQFNINFNPRKGKRLRIMYRGSSNEPNLSQLQPIPDNSNPLYITIGNPALKPEFDNNINISYNTMNPANFSFLFARLNFSNALNKITNQTEYNSQGQQIVTPVNANGYYSLSAFAGIGKPIKKYVVNLFTNTSYTNSVSFSNATSYFTRTFNTNARTSLNYNGDKLIYGPSFKIAYNNISYSLSNKPSTNYFSYVTGFNFQYNLPLDFKIGSDIQYTAYTGYAAGYNLTTVIWNGFISKNIFKNKKGIIKFQVNDILQQNKSVSITTADNYVENDRVNALPRFFLFSFSYSFSKFKGKKPEENQMDNPFGPHRFHDRND